MAFPCGDCLPCRIKRRRIWTHRILLEATQHSNNAFVTLTYDATNLPQNGSLIPSDLTNYIKKLRHKYRFRYFAVGEYGERTLRPHYHLALFGAPTCERGQTDLKRTTCCQHCETHKKTWAKGAIQLARLEPESSAYIAGYVTKKIMAAKLPHGLHKEFTRMSLKPGLGYGAVSDIASVLLQYSQEKTLEDVPTTLQHGTTKLPLGKYLRKNLRKQIGRDEKCPESVLKSIETQMQPLRESAFLASKSYKKTIQEVSQGKIAQTKARYKIRQQRHTL